MKKERRVKESDLKFPNFFNETFIFNVKFYTIWYNQEKSINCDSVFRNNGYLLKHIAKSFGWFV
jgi:hypothetical protein